MEKLSEWNNRFDYSVTVEGNNYRIKVSICKKEDENINLSSEHLIPIGVWEAIGNKRDVEQIMVLVNSVFRNLCNKINS